MQLIDLFNSFKTVTRQVLSSFLRHPRALNSKFSSARHQFLCKEI